MYRRISPLAEDNITIKDNPDAATFYCIPQEQMPDLILEVNK
jgi:hypothetical protein